MKIPLNKLNPEDLDTRNFVKIRKKQHHLTGKQSLHQLRRDDPSDPQARFTNADLNALFKMGFLDELVSGIKTGKEASVFLGRNRDGFVAVKVYTDLRVRSFKRDQLYREGRFIGDSRIEKAIKQGSEHGLDAHQLLWVQEEFRQMRHLYEHGVSVPRAIAAHGLSIIMEFVGDEDGTPAPRISDLKMQPDEAAAAFTQSVQNLKRIVSAGRVHGDYSAFNILWHRGQAVVIDFPQVMEFRNNRHADSFLERDVRSLCQSFRKQGVPATPESILKQVRAA